MKCDGDKCVARCKDLFKQSDVNRTAQLRGDKTLLLLLLLLPLLLLFLQVPPICIDLLLAPNAQSDLLSKDVLFLPAP